MVKKKESNNKSLIIKCITIISVVFVIIVLGVFIDNKDKFPLLGEYINTKNGEKLVLSLREWTIGEKEKLECNLWNCSGYSHGNYKVKKNIITFYYNPGYSVESYELKEENGQFYLIFKENDKVVNKYKKVK